MKLLTQELRDTLLANGRAQDRVRGTRNEIDFAPVVKFFDPCGAATWLITEMDTEDNDILFGLCDLGMGSPELGSVRLSELESIRRPFGLGIERDLYWAASGTLSQYVAAADEADRIVDHLPKADTSAA